MLYTNHWDDPAFEMVDVEDSRPLSSSTRYTDHSKDADTRTNVFVTESEDWFRRWRTMYGMSYSAALKMVSGSC